jgi:hypothetical protein
VDRRVVIVVVFIAMGKGAVKRLALLARPACWRCRC